MLILNGKDTMDNFFMALQLMGIGLATVFSVLLLIIFLGNVLIKLINKYAPEEEAHKSNAFSAAPNPVDANVAQAISMAISKITNGKSKADKIERI